MNQTVKLVLYVVLGGALVVLGYKLYSTANAPAPAPARFALVASNVTTSVTNAVATNEAGAVLNATTNEAPAVAATPVTPAPSDDDDIAVRKSSKSLGRMMGYGVAMFFVVVGLGFLIAHDVSRSVGTRVENLIFNDNLEGMKDPEYEEAERIWSSGAHLEAVRLMRNYLNKHPREQYVALRIAEIYEVDLKNYLAAALEYEEVLKKNLPAERWGWAAIHLANIYSGKLDRVEDATRLLRRIVDDYGQTAAAKKARERLGIPEPIAPSPALQAQIAAQQADEDAEVEHSDPEPDRKGKDEPPSHNLPPGFRPK